MEELPEQCKVVSLDHLVLTVKDISTTTTFYKEVLGMTELKFGVGGTRIALKFGNQKINLHQAGNEVKPHAKNPMGGSADLCFVTEVELSLWQDHLAKNGVILEEGPVGRTGANGPITSLYFRDPDQNLVEIAKYS